MTENQVLGDRVLIRPLVETKTTSGILINNSKERPKKGEVLLVGPGTKDVEMFLEPGYTVLFGEYSGINIDLDEEKGLLLMRQDDVFMITNKNKK